MLPKMENLKLPKTTTRTANFLPSPLPEEPVERLRARPDRLRSNADPIREYTVDTPDGFRIVTEQDCDDTIRAVHEARDVLKSKPKGNKYLGSVPLIVCQIWAKECGAVPGTREFAEYAHTKLTSGDYAKFKAWL